MICERPTIRNVTARAITPPIRASQISVVMDSTMAPTPMMPRPMMIYGSDCAMWPLKRSRNCQAATALARNTIPRIAKINRTVHGVDVFDTVSMRSTSTSG